jgi:hypothetical protein
MIVFLMMSPVARFPDPNSMIDDQRAPRLIEINNISEARAALFERERDPCRRGR